jgi:hypothetical protein
MWRDEFDAVFFFELLVQGVGVISSVADEAGREFVKEASGEGFFDELAFIGAVEIARMLPAPAMREKVLASARDFLFFGS